MATGPVRHHRFTYNCWVNSQDRPLSSCTQRLLFLISFFPYFFFFPLGGGSPEEQQHLRKLFEGCCRKRFLPWPAFPIAPAAQCLGAKAFLRHHGSSSSTLTILLLHRAALGADGRCPTSHFFRFPWGFHTGSSQEPRWGQTVLQGLFPPSPLLPFVIPVHSAGVFYHGTGTAWISRIIPFPGFVVLAGMGKWYLWPRSSLEPRMLPAFLPSCSEPGLRGPEPPLPLESDNGDRQSTGLDTRPGTCTWTRAHG